jgi:hypothetical protein
VTLDDTNCNRGLFFDSEMSSYCGRTARVQGQPPDRGIHGRDDRDQARLHRPRGHGLRGELPLLHACDLLLLARDLAQEGSVPPQDNLVATPA